MAAKRATGAECDEREIEEVTRKRHLHGCQQPGGGDPERLFHSSMAVDDDHSERERILNAVTIIVR